MNPSTPFSCSPQKWFCKFCRRPFVIVKEYVEHEMGCAGETQTKMDEAWEASHK